MTETKANNWMLGAAIGSVVALGLTIAACSNPLSPLMDGNQYICKTKPRTYYLPNGQLQTAPDYYAQPTPCPLVPID